ncbi:MAG TPA: hypothetical protein VK008_04360 [Sphingobacteriaceae bacterium]|nr:hypothetical protein [Sphingobacteriaceae bacterium]
MQKTWKAAVLEALIRYTLKYNTKIFSRRDLIQAELSNIVAATGSKGETPEQTLSRVLQELRDDGIVAFVDNQGTYELLLDIS